MAEVPREQRKTKKRRRRDLNTDLLQVWSGALLACCFASPCLAPCPGSSALQGH